MPPLFGLAPGGVCRAAAVAGARWALTAPFRPVAGPKPAADLLSVALSLGSPPPAVNRHRRSMEPGLSSPRLREPRPPDPLARAYIARFRARGPRAAASRIARHSPSIVAVDQLGPEAALEGDGRGLGVAHVIAVALEREQEAAVGPVRIDQVPRSAAAWRARAGRAAPSRTIRPDPACAPARRRNGRRRWRARSGGARRCPASSGSSAVHLLLGNGPVAEFVAGIDDLDADAAPFTPRDAAPVGRGRHARRASPRRPCAASGRPRRSDNGQETRASGSRSRAIAECGVLPCRYNGARPSRSAASRSSKLGEGPSMMPSMRPLPRQKAAGGVKTELPSGDRARAGAAACAGAGCRGRGIRDRRRSASVWPITVSPAPSISAPSGAQRLGEPGEGEPAHVGREIEQDVAAQDDVEPRRDAAAAR